MTYIQRGSGSIPNLSIWLQKGVLVKIQPGETVQSFTLRILTLDKKAFQNKIKTLMLNNGCVDDPETELLVSGDTLVLSGAMPGLVGAMLRSNSPIKAMRQSISGSGENRDQSVPEGMIRLKLFNTILSEYRENLLDCGFYIEENAT